MAGNVGIFSVNYESRLSNENTIDLFNTVDKLDFSKVKEMILQCVASTKFDILSARLIAEIHTWSLSSRPKNNSFIVSNSCEFILIKNNHIIDRMSVASFFQIESF